MIVSFAWTTEAFLVGNKTCTRRQWKESYFQQWLKAWREGRLVHEAYNKSPRANGHSVGLIRLTCEPYRERLGDMPESDVEAEGGLWKDKDQFIRSFGHPDLCPVVVRFDPLYRDGSSRIPRRK